MGKHRKKKKTRRDTVEIARSVVEQAIGEKLSGEPIGRESESRTEDTRNQAAVALSRLGASKGGKARAASLTAKRRKQIARKAARVRWQKTN